MASELVHSLGRRSCHSLQGNIEYGLWTFWGRVSLGLTEISFQVSSYPTASRYAHLCLCCCHSKISSLVDAQVSNICAFCRWGTEAVHRHLDGAADKFYHRSHSGAMLCGWKQSGRLSSCFVGGQPASFVQVWGLLHHGACQKEFCRLEAPMISSSVRH
jgi:hypothetical protein